MTPGGFPLLLKRAEEAKARRRASWAAWRARLTHPGDAEVVALGIALLMLVMWATR